LILLGITGIGKTALAERLVEELENWFEGDWSHVLRNNFEDKDRRGFVNVAETWLRKCGESVTSDDRRYPQRLLDRLIGLLLENRYLVLMDSLELILEGSEEQDWSDFAEEWWVKFFRRILSAEHCQSRIILTSQDLPRQFAKIGERLLKFWCYQEVRGLGEDERLALFERTGLDVSVGSQGRTYLMRIGAAYEGHPLALRLIAGEIRTSFQRDIVHYWEEYGHEIEEIENALEEAKAGQAAATDKGGLSLDRSPREMRGILRGRLEKTFDRLKRDASYAYLLLCSSSVYLRPVSKDFLLEHFIDWDMPKDWNEEKSNQVLDILLNRYLLEEVHDRRDGYTLRLHNLIRTVALERQKQLDSEDQ
jgi:hypothetical protein